MPNVRKNTTRSLKLKKKKKKKKRVQRKLLKKCSLHDVTSR